VQREELKAYLCRTLETVPDVVAAYLFGSVARGTDTSASDIDLAVLYASAPPAVLDSPQRRLEDEFEREVKRSVQVVCLNTAPPDLGIRVLRDGVLVCERDRAARIRFEVKLRNEFWDLEPTLRRCRKRERAAS